MFLQVVGQGFAYRLVYGTAHFVVSKFCLGLSFKLRFSYLDRNHGNQSFAEVLSGDFHFGFFECLAFFGIFLQYTGQGHTETGFMCTTFNRVDVVHIRMQVFAESRIVHDGTFDGNSLFFRVQVNYVVNQWCIVGVQETYELFHSFFGVEHFLFVRTVVFLHTLVGQRDGDAFVQVSQFAHAGLQDAVLIFSDREDAGIGPERLTGTGEVGRANFLHRVQRLSAGIFLLVHFSVAEYVGNHVGRQGVYARNTDSVQTSGYLVRTFVELTSGMEDCHYDFEG